MKLVVVNSRPEDELLDKFRPLGAFYCNYLGPGIISLEEEDPHHEGMPSAKHHIKAIKQVIDNLQRSEERRVGKEGRSRWSQYQ